MIRVLQSFPRPGSATNPYLTQLVESLPDDITILWWSWRAALFGRYDILHVHWPELLFRRDDPRRTFAHQCLFVLLMLRIAMTRIGLVRTVHNPSPHEKGSPFEGLLLRWCDRRTALWIALNDSTPIPPGQPSVVIPIGHYRNLYDRMSLPEPVHGRLLYFGLIRRYKGVLGLVAAFGRLVDSPDLTLRILGRPHPEELRNEIEAASRADPRVSAELRYVEDESLVRDIGESELVVLPYTEMHNSAAILLALSLDRPVLAPDTPTTAALAAEVGPGWLLTYRGELDPPGLEEGLRRVRGAARSTHPDLTAREWPALGAQHREAYLAALRR